MMALAIRLMSRSPFAPAMSRTWHIRLETAKVGSRAGTFKLALYPRHRQLDRGIVGEQGLPCQHMAPDSIGQAFATVQGLIRRVATVYRSMMPATA